MNVESEEFQPRRNVSYIAQVRINDFENDDSEIHFNE